MNLRLMILRLGVPAFVKKKKMEDLFRITALAFGCPPPELKGLSGKRLLESYARFTQDQAEKAVNLGRDVAAIKAGLFQGAAALGRDARRSLHLRSRQDVLAASRLLYRMLGIDFEGTPDGGVTISRCFFSQYYSVETCGIISSLDEGAVFGLSGGGELIFQERMTEGGSCCRARINFVDSPR
jgi:hypothetical protein